MIACLALLIAGAAPRPNLVVFMADDLGWNHVGVDGLPNTADPGRYETPHVAALAAEGLRFTAAYAQPNCAPTRSAMLTGQYPARPTNDVYVVGSLNRAGKKRQSKVRFKGPPQSEDVSPEAVTIAGLLRSAGYATAHVGKFHVGGHRGPTTLPRNVGFDINIGGGKQGHQPVCFATRDGDDWRFRGLGDGAFDRFASPGDDGEPKHVTDAVGDAAVETIGRLAAGDRPFYLQVFTYAVHGPVRARPDLLERHGGDQYAAFVAGMDEALGRVVAALGDPDSDGDPSDSVASETLLLFTSDNGGTHASNAPLRGKKGMFTEGGIRVPLIAKWPGTVEPGTTDRLTHCVDSYATFAELAGAEVPGTHAVDGHSFAGTLRGEAAGRGTGIGYLFPGYLDTRATPCVVYIDEIEGRRWKVWYDYETDAWSLYDLTGDAGESTDVFAERPQIAAEMRKRLLRWLSQEGPGWRPKYPIDRASGESVGPPRG